jgi:non-homologous end joining protein Ku
VPGDGLDQQPKGAPVVDTMDALRKSLEATRKPAQSETTGGRPRTKGKRRAK